MFSLTLTSFIWLNRCQMWYKNKVRRRTFSIVPYLRHLSNSSAQWLATVGCCQVMSGHSQPVVPKKMRASLLRELNSNSTYEHTYKHKNLAEMLPCSTHGMCIRNHQTQRMVQVPFNVFMGCQTFKYYFTTKWAPKNIKFYYPFTSQHWKPQLSRGYAVLCSQHCLKVVQVPNRQELQNDTTFSNLTGNQREEKKSISFVTLIPI